MLIDAHVHVTRDGTWFNTSHDASVDCLLRSMDEANVDQSVLLPIPQVVDNEFIAECCRAYPSRFIGFGAIDVQPDDDSKRVAEQFDAVDSLGLVGIKVHQRLQELPLRSHVVQTILEEAGKRGLPVVFCGYLVAASEKMRATELTPLEYDDLAKGHPKTTIVIAHMGMHRVLDAFCVARANPNVYLDTSYAFQDLQGSSAYQDLCFVLQRLDQKVIFGSDFPEVKVPAYVDRLLSELHRATDCDVEAICSGNLRRIIRKTTA